jgi:hypothetical protein
MFFSIAEVIGTVEGRCLINENGFNIKLSLEADLSLKMFSISAATSSVVPVKLILYKPKRYRDANRV